MTDVTSIVDQWRAMALQRIARQAAKEINKFQMGYGMSCPICGNDVDQCAHSNTDVRAAIIERHLTAAAAQQAILRDALGKIANGEIEEFDEETGDNVTVAMDMEEASKIASEALAQAMHRYEIVNDGPGRWVLADNWTDDPAPVYETREAAECALAKATGA